MHAGEASIELDPVLIVEDDIDTSQRLRRLIEELAGLGTDIVCVGNIGDAKTHLTTHVVHLALVDVGLPDGNGIDLIGWLHANHPGVNAVVVSAWGHEDTVLAALRAGAIGYLLKEREDAELSMALQSVGRGGAPIDPNIARRIIALPGLSPASDKTAPLSAREKEVLRLVARGYSNREIARLIDLSRFTVEDYTKSIYRKLAVGSRTAAVFEAKNRGLLR